MIRREFIAGLGGAAVWPVVARAQQSAMPMIGWLSSASRETTHALPTFVSGLSDAGYVEGRNVALEYRWADNHLDRLPALAAELVLGEVAVIVTFNTPTTLAAKAATKSIPIVFLTGLDVLASGLVTSLSHPGGNLTGMSTFLVDVAAKRLELLHELVPAASSVALLTNLANPVFAEAERRELEVAAALLGVRLLVANVSYPSEFERAFETLVRERVDALVVGSDTLFLFHLDQIVALAAHHALPAVYGYPEFVPAGGLMSYGTDFSWTYQQLGIYVGRILKGEKPADLPVQQVTKMELVINAKAAMALGLTFPLNLLGRADEVIE
jgi:putative tryptophan/tyrosine transport system substrate-binding protein